MIANKLQLTRSIYGTFTLDSIESNMTVNNLEKRNERNVSRHSLKSNKPQRESRGCI
jgi:hypothetical protein